MTRRLANSLPGEINFLRYSRSPLLPKSQSPYLSSGDGTPSTNDGRKLPHLCCRAIIARRLPVLPPALFACHDVSDWHYVFRLTSHIFIYRYLPSLWTASAFSANRLNSNSSRRTARIPLEKDRALTRESTSSASTMPPLPLLSRAAHKRTVTGVCP